MGLLAALQVTSVGMALCCCSLTTVGSVSLHAALQESTLGLCAAPCCFGITRVGSAGPQAALQGSEQGILRSTLLFQSCHSVS